MLLAGVFKALWKILYALNVCDYQLLDAAFFPMQGPGFLLVFLALAGMFTKYNRKRVNLSSVAAVPVFTSTMPFVILQIIGCAGMQWCLFALGAEDEAQAGRRDVRGGICVHAGHGLPQRHVRRFFVHALAGPVCEYRIAGRAFVGHRAAAPRGAWRKAAPGGCRAGITGRA